MSLKAFHIVFIVVSTVFLLGFGFWGIRDYALHSNPTSLILAILSLIGSVLLLGYGRWFLRKHKDLSYL